MIKKIFYIFIVICFLPQYSFSNDATISKPDSSDKKQELQNLKDELKNDLKELGVKDDNNNPISLQMIDLYRAQDEYTKNKTRKNKFNLVIAYEKVLAKTCIPNIYKDLTFDKESLSDECKKMINETNKLYKFSPIVACLENGYESNQCKEAYSHVILVDKYDDDKKNKEDESSDVNDFFKKLDENKIPVLKNALNKAIGDYRVTPTIKNYLNAITAANKLANNVCQDVKYFYSDTCTTCKENNSKIGNLDFFGNKEKNDKDKSDDENKKIDDEKDKIFDRNIYIPKECDEFITDIEKFEQKYPNITCLKNDPFSPACLKAIKIYRDNLRIMAEKDKENQKKENKIVIPDNGKNFDTF